MSWIVDATISKFAKMELNVRVFFGLSWFLSGILFAASGELKFSRLSHDFGTVDRGEKLVHKFKFRNTGKGVLRIHGVHTACGCTVADYDPEKVYAPGEEGTITAELDSTNFRGDITKTITVMSNSRTASAKNLTLLATIREEVYAEPPMVNFERVRSKNGAMKSFKVRSKEIENLQITKVDFDPKTMDVQFRKVGRDWEFSVTLKKQIEAGFFKDTIYVRNNSQKLAKLPVLIRANIIGSITHKPDYVEFGSVAEDGSVERTIELTKQDGFDVSDFRTEINVNGFPITKVDELIEITTVSKNELEKKIRVKLLNKSKEKGSVHGRLTLNTTDPSQKTINVDFYAFFR